MGENLLKISDSGNVAPFRERFYDFASSEMLEKCGAIANRTDAPQLSYKLPLAYSTANEFYFLETTLQQ